MIWCYLFLLFLSPLDDYWAAGAWEEYDGWCYSTKDERASAASAGEDGSGHGGGCLQVMSPFFKFIITVHGMKSTGYTHKHWETINNGFRCAGKPLLCDMDHTWTLEPQQSYVQQCCPYLWVHVKTKTGQNVCLICFIFNLFFLVWKSRLLVKTAPFFLKLIVTPFI